ncbi:ferritin-like domain-containing protein [Streptomyces sp. NBC_00638]|uniref:ferritin-like domain-containing protein n=1 Tax=unclassified Streptomyces TaxID=2593676 RepID=UPI00225AF8CD|nr:ferritin-like domain-containing protein [Streptomyces sp. NBC_00638]MCX5001135.1 ferritin-like domain-containing protein [Streptomyces sp. NBC_00638]
MNVTDETSGNASWTFPAAGDNFFTWDYDSGRERLLSLYQKGKDKQWDSTQRIDWSLDVDPYDALGTPEKTLALYGSRQYAKLNERERQEMRQHMAAWEFSQFLHGEQGAMICSARIVQSVPDIDSKFYAATQVMDEARHAEIFTRFLKEKIGLSYPINPHLKSLLEDALNDSRWDMPYLGMQVLIEGLALAAFGILRDRTDKPLPKQILAYVMQDEARHVAFGRLALRDYYAELSSKEIAEREEFVIQGCHLMRDRFRMQEVWENLGFDMKECMEYMNRGPRMRAFRSLLFARIVPCVRDIGLWSPAVRNAYDDMGVLDMANADLVKLMESDEMQADELDRERRETLARTGEVEDSIALGAADAGDAPSAERPAPAP